MAEPYRKTDKPLTYSQWEEHKSKGRAFEKKEFEPSIPSDKSFLYLVNIFYDKLMISIVQLREK